MDLPRKNQVSLRGASAREISRDALLEKLSQERELRSYVRRANAAALFIQRVWRRYNVTRKAALQIQEEWEILLHLHSSSSSGAWISNSLLRPFLFFIKRLSTQRGRIEMREAACIQNCFKIIMESIKSPDPRRNFCSLVIRSPEERRTWAYQAKNLITLCTFTLAACDKPDPAILVLNSLAMRLLVALTDSKEWKMVVDGDRSVVDTSARNLVLFLGSESGFHFAARKYIMNLDFTLLLQKRVTMQTDDRFLITASVITLALRPFHVILSDINNSAAVDMNRVTKCHILFLLTVPWLVQRLPSVLVPALKHKSVLSPCFRTLQISGGEILMEMPKLDHPEGFCRHTAIPPVGWLLANIICLMMGNESVSIDAKMFNQGVDHASYVRVVITLAQNLFDGLEKAGIVGKESQELECNCDTSLDPNTALPDTETAYGIRNVSFVDLFRPLYQQSHLTELLGNLKERASIRGEHMGPTKNADTSRTLELIDIAYFYSYLVRIFTVFNPVLGSLPVLNMLSFTPGLLTSLWGVLENSLFRGDLPDENYFYVKSSLGKEEDTSEEKHKQAMKSGVSKWSSVLHKITGKSQTGLDHNNIDSIDYQTSSMQIDRLHSDAWDVELLRCGPQGISRDMACLLFLFCATYSHLLVVLDDIEFYEKQVPFTLEQQRRITSALNTLVYNGLSRGSFVQNKHLMEYAIKCLHMMYERDCRHQFCPPSLWLSPASQSRPPIQVAARMHEVLLTKSDDLLPVSSMGSVITTVPHVYPFEERVEMFREFIKMDKVSRAMAGEDAVPGLRKVEIVIRRDHIVEDGFRQLNLLGSRLKSSIHVSFVSECGLPEAGLDYGGGELHHRWHQPSQQMASNLQIFLPTMLTLLLSISATAPASTPVVKPALPPVTVKPPFPPAPVTPPVPPYVKPPAPPVTVKPPVPPVVKPPAPPVTVKPPSPPVTVTPPVPPFVKPPAPPVTVKPPPSPPVVKPPAPLPPLQPPTAPPLPPVKSKADCIPLCSKRCSLHSRKRVCMRACMTCCDRCKCVPPGTYGNRELCGKCYTDMTTHGSRIKCP